jgi:hypothetical protein
MTRAIASAVLFAVAFVVSSCDEGQKPAGTGTGAKDALPKASTDPAKAAAELPKGLEKVADPSVTVDSLKGMIGSLNADSLKPIAENLVKAIQSQDGVVAGLKDQISKLGVTDVLKGAELKKSLDSATGLIPGLKEKLQVVVDKLKASGIDVSKYTSFLPTK